MFGIWSYKLEHSESIKGAMDIEMGVRNFRDNEYGVGIRYEPKDGEIV